MREVRAINQAVAPRDPVVVSREEGEPKTLPQALTERAHAEDTSSNRMVSEQGTTRLWRLTIPPEDVCHVLLLKLEER